MHNRSNGSQINGPRPAKNAAADSCRWRERACGSCRDENPFSTQNFCPAAVRLFYASDNLPCPQCGGGYLHLNQKRRFECPQCGFSADYTYALEKESKF